MIIAGFGNLWIWYILQTSFFTRVPKAMILNINGRMMWNRDAIATALYPDEFGNLPWL